MTKNEVMKEFLKKTILPIVAALLLFSIFSRIFTENGSIDFSSSGWLAAFLLGLADVTLIPLALVSQDSRRCCMNIVLQR